jgi:divalent metal cation (Fe/Co/Zn/Cd) transporter
VRSVCCGGCARPGHTRRSARRAPLRNGALYVVAVTFFLLALYITWKAAKSLISREEPLTSPVGIILAGLSLAVMTARASVKQRVG